MMYRVSRQTVTGMVVNAKVNPDRKYKHKTRAMVHSLITRGYFFLHSSKGVSKFSIDSRHFRHGLERLRARVSYLVYAELCHQRENPNKTTHSESVIQMWRILTIFCSMYCIDRTTLVWKRPRSAMLIRALDMLSTETSASDKSSLRIFRTSQLASKLFHLDNPSTDWHQLLAYAIHSYKLFGTVYPNAKPLIFLVDVNDWIASGMDEIQLHADCEWFHIANNLYILLYESTVLRGHAGASQDSVVLHHSYALTCIKQIEKNFLDQSFYQSTSSKR
jgi:hypothetical protein